VLRAMVDAVLSLGLDPEKVVVMAGIGCCGRIVQYLDYSTVHTPHGRALAVATGAKIADPGLRVLVVMGDGDCTAIGGNHLIHAARRNIDVTAVVFNNSIYGMTGGQSSATTPKGAVSQTAPFGHLEKSFDLVKLTTAAGANGVSRGTVFHVNMLDRLIAEAVSRPGFNLVEIMSPCFTQYGRKNKFKSAVDMFKWLKTETSPLESWEQLPPEEKAKRLPIGTFLAGAEPGLEVLYGNLRDDLAAKEQPR
jgi:2-oxoglutarate ferredoxin oxidoreductase subunit beta